MPTIDEHQVGSAMASSASSVVMLDRETEYRFEVAFDAVYSVTLLSGTAEIWGTELAAKKPYVFSGCKIGLFSWHGCRLEVEGTAQVAYTSDATPMVTYLNAHVALEQRREKADLTKENGPRVIIVGAHDVGKSTLSQMLLNWAIRRGRRPLYVDLDVGQGCLAVPGALGAVLTDKPLDVVEGISNAAPIVYHYGHVSPEQNTTLFKRLVTTLASRLEKRCIIDDKVRTSGYIINTPGWVDGQGLQLLHHYIDAFGADVIMVLDHERLYNELRTKAVDGNSLTVVRLQKSGGVVTRPNDFRFAERSRQIRKYFYGVTTKKDGRIVSSSLFPHVTQIKFDGVHFFKIGAPAVPLACLPLGVDPTEHETKLTSVTPTEDLLHSILSVSNAPVPPSFDDEDARRQIVDSTVAGFIYISEVNVKAGTMTALAPAPGGLPGKILLTGTIKWME